MREVGCETRPHRKRIPYPASPSPPVRCTVRARNRLPSSAPSAAVGSERPPVIALAVEPCSSERPSTVTPAGPASRRSLVGLLGRVQAYLRSIESLGFLTLRPPRRPYLGIGVILSGLRTGEAVHAYDTSHHRHRGRCRAYGARVYRGQIGRAHV